MSAEYPATDLLPLAFTSDVEVETVCSFLQPIIDGEWTVQLTIDGEAFDVKIVDAFSDEIDGDCDCVQCDAVVRGRMP